MITQYCIWYVSATGQLLYIDFTGTLQECVNIIEARFQGSWAILPKLS